MTFDLRAWALHDAVYQLARESGLRSFRVECKLGPQGETVIALILARPSASPRDPFTKEALSVRDPARDEGPRASARKRRAR